MPICSPWAAARYSACRNVGPAADQVGWNPDHHLGPAGGNRPVAENLRELQGRHPQQRTQGVLGLPDRDFQGRNARLGLPQVGHRLVEVQLGLPVAVSEPLGDEVHDTLLELCVFSQEPDPLLIGPDRHVVLRHLAQQRDQHAVVIPDGSLQVVVGRRDGPPQLAPKIELPTQSEPIVPLVEEAVGSYRIRGNGLSIPHETALHGLLLRKHLAHGDRLLRPGLHDAVVRLAERQVLGVGASNQLIEFGIVKDCPPVGNQFRVRRHAELRGVDPAVLHRRRRLIGVRTDLETVVYVIVETRAAGQ